jgi:hypothetical protein
VLRPDTDFFRFFGDPTGKAPPNNATAGEPAGAAASSAANPPRAPR